MRLLDEIAIEIMKCKLNANARGQLSSDSDRVFVAKCYDLAEDMINESEQRTGSFPEKAF